jgi:hypothetical protein
MLHTYDIGKLDISRIYRYLNKYLGIEIIEADSSVVAKTTSDNNDGCQDEENDE